MTARIIEEDQGVGRVPDGTGLSSLRDEAASASSPKASIPSRSEFARGLIAAAEIAEKWRDENRKAAAKARTRESRLNRLGMDHPGMAEMLDGAAIECNAIASEIRRLAETA